MKGQLPSSFVVGILVVLVLTSGVALAQPMEEAADLAAPPLSHYIRIEEATVDTLSPAVAYNSRAQEFLVVWEQYIHGGEVAIYGRRVSISGQTIGPAFPVQHLPLVQFYRPAVAYSPEQDSYLVAMHRKVSADDYNVLAVPVSGDGKPGTIFAIDIDLDRDWYPAITYSDYYRRWYTDAVHWYGMWNSKHEP